MIVFWTWLDVNDDEESSVDLDSEATKKYRISDTIKFMKLIQSVRDY
ncbi:hypothetical protein BRLA_c025020 [Brevibacillus laterosporus LMG 15441]|uniref:Uncharacterized protein n=1 Tax=Brevibacillus laterosporus LMG 15441 TaxID=1042163 RepID=A0A075R2R2_BRELA|nr:hypothetical protein BRLA_c025020 [Brevibacillus laterosporus LMG 15441]